MTVHLAKCSSCKNLVAQDGLEHHIVLLSWISAATAVWVRSMANNATLGLALTTSATMWLRASRREEAAGTIARCNKPLSGRSLREVAMAGLNLMTTDLQPALFSCNRCVGEDGRYKCVAADSIWVGYGSRAAENERFENVAERVPENIAAVKAAYMVRGDSVRRVIRDLINPKGAALNISAKTLRAVEIGVGLLLPGALPADRVRAPTANEKAISDLLRQVWDVDKATAATLQQLKSSLQKYKTRSEVESSSGAAAAEHLSQLMLAKAKTTANSTSTPTRTAAPSVSVAPKRRGWRVREASGRRGSVLAARAWWPATHLASAQQRILLNFSRPRFATKPVSRPPTPSVLRVAANHSHPGMRPRPRSPPTSIRAF